MPQTAGHVSGARAPSAVAGRRRARRPRRRATSGPRPAARRFGHAKAAANGRRLKHSCCRARRCGRGRRRPMARAAGGAPRAAGGCRAETRNTRVGSARAGAPPPANRLASWPAPPASAPETPRRRAPRTLHVRLGPAVARPGLPCPVLSCPVLSCPALPCPPCPSCPVAVAGAVVGGWAWSGRGRGRGAVVDAHRLWPAVRACRPRPASPRLASLAPPRPAQPPSPRLASPRRYRPPKHWPGRRPDSGMAAYFACAGTVPKARADQYLFCRSRGARP